MGIKISSVLPVVYLLGSVIVAAYVLLTLPAHSTPSFAHEQAGTLSVYPIVHQYYNTTFSLVNELQISGGEVGYYIDDKNQPVYLYLFPVAYSAPNVTYWIEIKGYGTCTTSSIAMSPSSLPGQNLVMEALYYKKTLNNPDTTVIVAVSYINGETNMPFARVAIFQKGVNTYENRWVSYDTQISYDVNLSQMVGHTLNMGSPSDVYTRLFLVPYTIAPEVGTYYNTPENFMFLYATVKDLDGIWTTIYTVTFDGIVSEPKITYADSIIIPLGFLYSLDRSKIYVFEAALTSSSPNTLQIMANEFDATNGDQISGVTIGSVTLPTNMYYPDIFVYYLKPYVTFVQDPSGNFITEDPIRFVLYSPTAQKAYYVAVSLNVTMSASSISATVTSASVEKSIDLSTVTGGDIQKARLMHPDFISPRAQLYGPIFARQAVFDSDVLYNPYTYKVYIYTDQGWKSFVLENVVPKVDYLKPKTNVQNNYLASYGYLASYISDLQYLSQDGVQTQGWVLNMVRFVPYTKYSVTPTKFTYRIQYTYYVTPITITYTKADPDEPDTLTNVLVPINITDPTILSTITTADARDVRFFMENTYGGDYWKYSGLTYAIKERTSDYITFYVLIPSITADSPITIYMYSGFQYANPVASNYWSLISAYPLLLTQT